MPRYRALVIGRHTSISDPGHAVTNTVYFDDHGATTDADGLAQDLRDVYIADGNFMKGCNEIETRFYDMAEPEPREIQALAVGPYTAGGAGSAAREVALCLSFYSERNLPRNRGRIYLGPVGNASGNRPDTSLMNSALGIASDLAALGGVDVDWCVFSPRSLGAGSDYDAAFKKVSHAWVDNEWDTVRSRGLKGTERVKATVSG